MHLSAQNELLFRKAAESEDKKAEIAKISAQIEEIDREMATEVGTGYLDVISKCDALEQLQQGVKEMRTNTTQLYSNIKDMQLRQWSIANEYAEVERAVERLKEIQHALLQIHEFLEQAMQLQDTNDIYVFVESMERMEQMKAYLKRYSFYSPLNDAYRVLKDRFTEQLQSKVAEWIREIDYAGIGSRLNLKNNTGIFDRMLVYRKELLGVDFLKVVYASKRLNLENKIIQVLEFERSELIRKIYKEIKSGSASRSTENKRLSSDVVYVCVSSILLDAFILDCFSTSKSFIQEIFELINIIDITDLHVLLPLKNLVTALKLDSEPLDRIVEKAAYAYFNKRIHKEDFFRNMKAFINYSVEFLDQLSEFSNELDELLAKRVDDLLVERLEAFSEGEGCNKYAELGNEVSAVINHLVGRKISLMAFNFRSQEAVRKKNKIFVEKRYGELSKMFKETDDMDAIVKELISLKGFMNEECRTALVAMIRDDYRNWISEKRSDDLTLVADTLNRNFTDGVAHTQI